MEDSKAARAYPARAQEARTDERELVAALRAGDEAAFLTLVERHHRSVIRFVRAYLPDDAAAEDVAQEAWAGVLKGIDGFEGRSSVATWIFGIAVNCARTRRARDARLVPLSALGGDGDDGPAVDPHRFQPRGSRYADNWAQAPEPWAEERLQSAQLAALVRQEIERLPANQRTAITLRDVEGLGSGDVCAALGITEGNQRVLLHRARSRVRAALERLLQGGGDR